MNGPFVLIDDRCATSMRNVWAIGDLTGEPMLAHRAMAQGEMVAEIIAGHKRAFDNAAIPAIMFTDPEVVSVGLSPDAAREKCGETRVGVFPLRANGRALTLQADDGFVRIVARSGQPRGAGRAGGGSRGQRTFGRLHAGAGNGGPARRCGGNHRRPPDRGRSLSRSRAGGDGKGAAYLGAAVLGPPVVGDFALDHFALIVVVLVIEVVVV